MTELREALEEAYEDEPESSTEEAVGEDVESLEPESAEDPVEEPEESTEEETTAESAEESEEPQPEADTEHAEEVEAATVSTRAPVSWRPGVRDHWAKLPGEVREEVERREQEINQTLQDTAEARKFNDEFNKTIEPFRPIIASQGSDPLTATKNLMETAAGLSMGSPTQRAQIVSNIIKQYGVDIATLDQILSDQVTPEVQQQTQMEQIIQQQMAPFQNFMTEVQQARQQREQQVSQSSMSEIEVFSQDPANEFFNDVREDMADLLEIAAKRGKDMTLKDAYNAAINMNPELANIVSQRTAASQANITAKRVAKKKAAASSVSGAPGGGQTTDDGTLRGAIANAFEGE